MTPVLIAALFAGACAAQVARDQVIELARRAVELQQSGSYADAAAAYQKLLQLTPGDVATHVNLGVVLVRLGRFDEAIREYAAADKLLPGDPRIALNTALAYEKSGRLDEAARRFELLHAATPQDARIAMLLADCRLQLDDHKAVIQLLQPLEAAHSDDLGLAYMLGMAFLREGRAQDAQARLDRILRNGDSAEARFLLGVRMFESGDYPAAVKQLAGAAELNPSLPQLQSLYGQALLNTGDPDAACDAFRKELASNPNDFAANLNLARILTVRRRFNEAGPLLERALLLRPQSAVAEQLLAECLAGEGNFEKARPLAESAAAALPDSPDAHRTLSEVYNGLRLASRAGSEQKKVELLGAKAAMALPGPKVGEMAPDFDLAGAAPSDQRISLRKLLQRGPVVLLFGSYSCPNFRAAAPAMKELEKIFGTRVAFLLVYIREAHAGNNWQSTRNQREGVNLEPAATMVEKQDHALMCRRDLHLNFRAVVDNIDGAVETAYGAWPSRLFVVGAQGRVLYSTYLTELDFHAGDVEAILRRLAPQGARAAK